MDERFADSLASWRRFPNSPPEKTLGAAGTEQPFHEMVGTGDPLQGVDPRMRDFMVSELRRKGVTDFAGKRYFAGLANEFADPRALVGSRSEMAALITERGYESQGLVHAHGRESSDPITADAPYTVADDVVHKTLRDYWRNHPAEGREAVSSPERAQRVFDDMREFLSGRGSCPLHNWERVMG